MSLADNELTQTSLARPQSSSTTRPSRRSRAAREASSLFSRCVYNLNEPAQPLTSPLASLAGRSCASSSSLPFSAPCPADALHLAGRVLAHAGPERMAGAGRHGPERCACSLSSPCTLPLSTRADPSPSLAGAPCIGTPPGGIPKPALMSMTSNGTSPSKDGVRRASVASSMFTSPMRSARANSLYGSTLADSSSRSASSRSLPCPADAAD